MAEVFLYEFKVRGRITGDPGWSVNLAVEYEAFGKTETKLSDVMSPAAAAAQGFELPDILALVNQEIMAAHDAKVAEIAALSTDKAALLTDKAALEKRVADLEGEKAAAAEAVVVG